MIPEPEGILGGVNAGLTPRIPDYRQGEEEKAKVSHVILWSPTKRRVFAMEDLGVLPLGSEYGEFG